MKEKSSLKQVSIYVIFFKLLKSNNFHGSVANEQKKRHFQKKSKRSKISKKTQKLFLFKSTPHTSPAKCCTINAPSVFLLALRIFGI